MYTQNGLESFPTGSNLNSKQTDLANGYTMSTTVLNGF